MCTINYLFKAWLYELVLSDKRVIKMHDKNDKKAFYKISTIINNKIEKMEKETSFEVLADNTWYNILVSLRNLFRPDEFGKFDNLETQLRNMQFSDVEHPNPHYEEFQIFTSSEYAKSFLAELEEDKKNFVNSLASVFK